MSVKVIFLDIDGVLCTHRSNSSVGSLEWKVFDRSGVGLLSQFCTQHGGWSICISSTWRKFNTETEMKNLLVEAGLDPSVCVLPHLDIEYDERRSGFG